MVDKNKAVKKEVVQKTAPRTTPAKYSERKFQNMRSKVFNLPKDI